MAMKKMISLVLAAVMLAGCANVPQNVKDNYGSSTAQDFGTSAASSESTADTDAEKVDITQLDAYNAKLGGYIKQKGYDKNFFLPDEIKITTPGELYSFKMKQANKAYEKFPQVYKYCFGSDFARDSGADDISKLALSDGEKEIAGFIHIRSIFDEYVRFIDSRGFDEKRNYYTTGLNISSTGFINFENSYDSFAYDGFGEYKDVYYSRGESDSEQLMMSDGSRYSCDEARAYAEKFANGLLQIYTADFEYKVKVVRVFRNDDAKHLFYIIFQKYYKGTPISDLLTYEYHDPIHTKWMQMNCNIIGRERLASFNAPFGFETLESSERVNEKLIPVTRAVDIMHENLAEHIKLHIFDVKLMYFNEYDGSRYEKAMEMFSASGKPSTELPQEVQKDLFQPEMNAKNEYKCYPAWVFYIPKQGMKASKYGVTEIERHCNYIVVNALTGEMKSYVDPASAY